jgi:hypothetical protein
MIIHPKGFMAVTPAVGNGSDGVLSTSGNVSLTSTTDGDAVVKQYQSLTVNSGHTLTVSNRCKGLHIYVQGDLVLNGTISMTARGASASNANQLVTSKSIWNGIFSFKEFEIIRSIFPYFEDITISSSSANGGNGVYAPNNNYINGNNGSNGSSLFQCGGGGSGACGAHTGYGATATSGRGGNSTFFSGGAGSGGVCAFTSSLTSSQGSDTGGAGSNGNNNHPGMTASSGVGNPTGGTGGQLIIMVGGKISGSGAIESKGSNCTSAYYGGGGSGGGCILLLTKSSFFSGSILSTGGLGTGSSNSGGSGGNGFKYYDTFDNFWTTYG